MTPQEWIDKAKADRTKLRSLVVSFHPASRVYGREPLKVTAPNAEAACNNVRTSIRRNHDGDPGKQFDEALDGDDYAKVNTLLNAAWFGVPESTECWRLEGFKEAVDLMEDLPGDDGQTGEEELSGR